jgi:cytochrome c oxidase subunit 2
MKRSRMYPLALAVLATLALRAIAQEPPGSLTPDKVYEIQMTARKYEFNPCLITVKKGEHVRLIITALDRDHGFKLEAFGINQKLKKGDPATIEFTADRVGTFKFQCSVFCGFGHGRMKGKVVVEE